MLMGERSGWKVNWELERRYTSDFLTRQESRRAPNNKKTVIGLVWFVLLIWFEERKKPNKPANQINRARPASLARLSR